MSDRDKPKAKDDTCKWEKTNAHIKKGSKRSLQQKVKASKLSIV